MTTGYYRSRIQLCSSIARRSSRSTSNLIITTMRIVGLVNLMGVVGIGLLPTVPQPGVLPNTARALPYITKNLVIKVKRRRKKQRNIHDNSYKRRETTNCY